MIVLIGNMDIINNGDETTALYKAAWKGHKEIISLLIHEGINIDLSNQVRNQSYSHENTLKS